MPYGSWERAAVYVSRVALPREDTAAARRLATRLRAVPGVSRVEVGAGGLLLITVAVPGEIVSEIVAGSAAWPGRQGTPTEHAVWPDFPRTWANPGFIVRYGYVRAVSVQRWARDLGLTTPRDFHPERLSAGADRAVLRLLAESPSRSRHRAHGRAAYLERLAAAYHDAHEQCPAIPSGDERFTSVHIARLWLARAVRVVLDEGMTALGEVPPQRI
jgi:Arginyl-tRNA synthetase